MDATATIISHNEPAKGLTGQDIIGQHISQHTRAPAVLEVVERAAESGLSDQGHYERRTVMGVMIVPFMSSPSDDVINAVPQSLRDGSYAMGATKLETGKRVVLPAALSGIEICRSLRARPETRDIPIIMLTARGEETERVCGLATGADDYVVKPFSVPELLARVKSL